MSADRWPCAAYGTEGLRYGAHCFVAGAPFTRRCLTREVCEATMAEERQQLFDRMTKRAAAGDELAREVLADVTGPEQLLGGAEQ